MTAKAKCLWCGEVVYSTDEEVAPECNECDSDLSEVSPGARHMLEKLRNRIEKLRKRIEELEKRR